MWRFHGSGLGPFSLGRVFPLIRSSLAIVVCFLFLTRPAHAYLDPGTGAMIVQAIIGAFIGAGLFLKFYWYRVKAFFRWKLPKPGAGQ